MAIVYLGIAPSQQVTRSFYRVTLAGGFAVTDLLSGPFSDFTTWAGKIAQWRELVTRSSFPVPLIPSPAAVDQSGFVTPESRAIVDVQIHGAVQGVSVADVALAMDTLVPRVDVLSIQLIGTLTDDTGRGAALTAANAEAARESLQSKALRFAGKAGLVLAGVVVAVALAAIVLTRKAK